MRRDVAASRTPPEGDEHPPLDAVPAQMRGAHQGAGPWRRTNAATVAVVAVVVAAGAGAIRVLIPLVYVLREDGGLLAAAGCAFGVFLTPVLAAPLRRVLGSRPAVGVALSGLTLGVIAIQFVHPIPLWLAAMATVCALVVWTLLLHGARSSSPATGGATFAAGVVTGLALDAAVHALFGTWDPAWRPGLLSATSTLALVVATLASIPTAMSIVGARAREPSLARVIPLGVLGPFLMLQLLFLANIAFADSAAGLSILGGATLVLAGETLSLAALAWSANRATLPVRVGGGLALVVLAWLVTGVHGLPAAAVLLAASALSGPMLAMGLSRGGDPDRPGAWRTSATTAAGTVVFLALAFLYQIHITNPLPVSNRVLPVLAALLLGAGAIAPGPSLGWVPAARRLVVVPLALLLVVAGSLFATRPSMAAPAGDVRAVRIMDWNIHSAVNGDGQLDPATIAQEIQRQHPDVVVLQEVARGWLIAGTTDLAEWLSMHVGLPFAWAPAADGQFGNVVLSRLPIASARAVPLPYGVGPQHRSYLRVSLDLGGGKTAPRRRDAPRVEGRHRYTGAADPHDPRGCRRNPTNDHRR